MNFSNEEMINMTFILGECAQNCLLASRVYRQRYRDRRHPRKEAFERLKSRLVTSGTVKYKAHTYPKTIATEENEMMVLQAVIEDPNVSLRTLSNNLNISIRSVQRLLKKNRFHPYKIQLHQELLPIDHNIRLKFCERIIGIIEQEPDFWDTVLWTDESIFHNNGCVNTHNFHYYADNNPHIIHVTGRQNRWSLNVWAAIIGTHVIGPYFFNGHLNGATYRDFLVNELGTLLENVPLLIRRRMRLQHDGAPCHNHHNVREWLNQTFGNRWIGRGGPIAWPARSPDLTPLDYFLWGYTKNIVYKQAPTTREDMQGRIRRVFQEITPDILIQVRASFIRRLRVCIDNNGGHFENFLA